MAARKAKPRAPAPDSWSIYKQHPGLVLGFHGCDRSIANAVLSGKTRHLKASENDHDWLGPGIYFWEQDPWRALEWAYESRDNQKQTVGRIKDPYVIGAVLDLGHCCNLVERDAIAELKKAHQVFDKLYKDNGLAIPVNKGGPDLAGRFRDRWAVSAMHWLREQSGLPKYDSVRAAFLEGAPLYEQAGFRERNHIQIACSPKCIKGYFRLPDL